MSRSVPHGKEVIYEGLVGIVKGCIRKSLRCLILFIEDFQTLITETVNGLVINTRPLTYTYEDIGSNIGLRPINFLIFHASLGYSTFEQDHEYSKYLPRGTQSTLLQI